MRRFQKSDIDFHYEGFGRSSRPAINVKMHRCNWDAGTIAESFRCDDATAEKAAGFAWEAACQLFWEQVQDEAEHIFGKGVRVYSEGRSGGWLVVHGINTDVESWDAIAVSRWGRLVRWADTEKQYRLDWAQIKEDIEANRWAEAGAEQYNFLDKANGSTVCIAELKQQAVAAGFRDVVR